MLLLDKPAGMTSNAALQAVKRLYQARKAGHTGSLDPLATGLLPLCFGEATKVSGFLLDADKRYRVVCKLGERTTTGDAEGEVLEQRPVENVTGASLRKMLERFVGEIEQIPPMYSAVKQGGVALHKLARQGEVELDVLAADGRIVRALSERGLRPDESLLGLAGLDQSNQLLSQGGLAGVLLAGAVGFRGVDDRAAAHFQGIDAGFGQKGDHLQHVALLETVFDEIL